jgi:hypothetical protein
MFSKILIKLVDQAIVPTIYLVTARMVSLVFIVKLLDLPFRLSREGFSFLAYEDYLTANSYSALFMSVALCLGLGHIMVKSLIFHDTHITPALTAKVFAVRAQHLIQNSFNLYVQGAVWLAFLYLLTLGTLVMGLFGSLYLWVFLANLGMSLGFTYLFVMDVEREIFAAERKRK